MSAIHPSTKFTEFDFSTPFEPSVCLNDPTLFKLYQTVMRSQKRSDIIAPLLCLGCLAGITRYNLQNIGQEGVFFSFAVLLIGTLLFIPFVATRLVSHHPPSNKVESSYYRRCVSFQQLATRLHLQDIICVICVVVNGLVLLGRVYAGQCDDTVTLWTNQCNPFANVALLPPDQVMLVYLAPIIGQLVVGGISATALVGSWLLGVAFVAIATSHVRGGQQLRTLSYSLFYIMIVFMIEELTRTTFMQGQVMIAASAASLKQELVFMEVSAVLDKQSKENEVYQLKSLMGNVAHDLKTPLHSIEADLDIIRIFISKIPKSALEIACEDLRVNGNSENNDIVSILNRINASCKFMGMSMKRSQDFMKSSRRRLS